MRRISSLVEQVFDGEDVDTDFVQTIRTVSPARTFLEKAFLLCEEYQKDKPRTHRMTRQFLRFGKTHAHSLRRDGTQKCSSLY